jgi:hypothetical protein
VFREISVALDFVPLEAHVVRLPFCNYIIVHTEGQEFRTT